MHDDVAAGSVARGELKVAILRHSLFLPSEPFIPDQARALAASKVMIARDAISNPIPELSCRTLSERSRVAAIGYTLGLNAREMYRVLSEERPDVVHAHFGVEGMFVTASAARLGIPVVTTLHGFDVTLSREALIKSKKPAWLRYARGRSRFLAQSRFLVCVSGHIRQRAIELGAREDATVVIPTGVDTAQLVPTDLPAIPRIAHVARLVEKKGTATLVEAVARLHQRGIKAELSIVGDGPLRSELEARVRELGIRASVAFLGSLPHIRTLEVLRSARIVCQPSVTASSGDQEGLPQVVLEAGSLGRPVVGTRHSGIVEAIEHESTGLLVDEFDVDGLADALEILLEDTARANAFGRAGHERIRAEFDIHSQARKLERFYRTAINDR